MKIIAFVTMNIAAIHIIVIVASVAATAVSVPLSVTDLWRSFITDIAMHETEMTIQITNCADVILARILLMRLSPIPRCCLVQI